MAYAGADSVAHCHKNAAKVDGVKTLVFFDGVHKNVSGVATKGTMLQFDCNESELCVLVDEKVQGAMQSPAFGDVYLDEKCE